MVEHIASAKILEREESISASSFFGQLPNYQSHVFQSYLPSGWVLLKGNEDEDVGSVQDFILLLFSFGVKQENQDAREFKIPLSNRNGGNFLLRQSRIQNSVKHQRRSYSAKTANGLNTLTVFTKKLHHRLSTGFQTQV